MPNALDSYLCNWCGRDADARSDDCIQLTCNTNCHNPRDYEVYHEKCIKQYLRGFSGKNYDPSRKSGFPCPRGLGKIKSATCKGKISHMQRCIIKSKPAAVPSTPIAPAADAVHSKATVKKQHAAAAKKDPVSAAKASTHAAGAAPAASKKVGIKAVQIHKPIKVPVRSHDQHHTAAWPAAQAGPFVQSVASVSSSVSSTKPSDNDLKLDSLGRNTLALTVSAAASKTAKKNAKRAAVKASKRDQEQSSDVSSSCSGVVAVSSGVIAVSSGRILAAGHSRPSTSVSADESGVGGISNSLAASTSDLVGWGSAYTDSASTAGQSQPDPAVSQAANDDYAYVESDSDQEEQLQWHLDVGTVHDQVQLPKQEQLEQLQERQQQENRGAYTLFGDVGLPGGLGGFNAALPGPHFKLSNGQPSEVPGSMQTTAASVRLDPAVSRPALQQQHTQPQLTPLQQAQLEYQRYKQEQEQFLLLQAAAQQQKQLDCMDVSTLFGRQQLQQQQWWQQTVQEQQEQQLNRFGAQQGFCLPCAGEEATDEELLALLLS